METEAYVQQLQAINQMLENSPEGDERLELLNLKQNIEELLSLTREVDEHSKICSKEDETVVPTTKNKQENNTKFDDEYELFMAEMAKEGVIDLTSETSNDNIAGTDEATKQPAALKKITNSLKQLEGKKFRAPHKHSWGQVVYHNAMVCSVPDDIPSNYEFEVKVLFLNPTHKEMLPCPYYFHLEKDCNFKEGGCGYSHGELVPFSSLQEYVEPKFELLTIGSEVLAMQMNNLWSRAKITQIVNERHVCLVKFDSKNVENQSFEEIPFASILPLLMSEHTIEDDSDNDSDVEVVEESFEEQVIKDRQELINTSLMTTPDTQKLGDWEKYTKGIGSKLMQKMGYIVGTGLGKSGSGIIKPVTATLLPQGKSLDYCMNLKEQQNDPNLFNADCRKPFRERKRRQLTRKAKSVAKSKIIIEQMDLVEFINCRCSTSKVHWKFTKEQEYELLKNKLKLGSDKDVNTASFIIEEKLKKCEEVVENLRAQIQRLQEVHADTHKLLQRLHHAQDDLKRYNTYKMVINNEITRRKNNKEMAVF